MLTVLYLVGRDAPTSVPLEVVHFIRNERVRLVIAVFYGGSDNEVTQDFSHPFVHLKAQGSMDLRGIRGLRECIVQYRPDVIHVHHTASAFWGTLLGKVFAGSAVVRSEHNNHQYCSLGQNTVNWIGQLLSDRILCNSENTYGNFHPWEKWVVGECWEKVYNGVDVGRIDRASQRHDSVDLIESKNRIVIGSVGRLIPVKNYERLIRAFSLVTAERPEVHLVLIGNGEQRTRLEYVSKELNLTDHITFLGEVSRDEVYSALHAFDIFVAPSLSEGFCNAAVEAMAVGLPIVCSDIQTLHEVVGDVATYVDPESPDSIARGLIELIQQGPAGWRERGHACRERAVGRYAIERTAEAYVRNYFIAAGRDVPKSILEVVINDI